MNICAGCIIFTASHESFSDRILEAEKICDKQEMEQFPNEGDDIQVIHLGGDILQILYLYIFLVVPVYFHLVYLQVIQRYFFSGKIQICC